MTETHTVAFEGGGAVEFARQLKALREEQDFRIELLQCEGRFPPGSPEVLTLTLQTEDFEGTTEELRLKVSAYVPAKKTNKKVTRDE